MDNLSSTPRQPVVAIVGEHEWLIRSLESIFSANGFTTVARSGVEPASIEAIRPDILVLEGGSEPGQWQSTLEAVRRIGCMTRATPIIGVTAETLCREHRVAALRAGAWDVFGHPLDAESLILKAGTFVAAKLEEEDHRDRSLIDAETDLYNVRGVLRRIYEEASEAARHSRPLACLVASVELSTGSASAEAVREVAQAFRRVSRSSDVFGRLGRNEFVVVAPGTDATGARVFAQRLASTVGVRPEGDPSGDPAPVRTGFAAVSDVVDSGMEPVDLFVRAVAALRAAQASSDGDRVVAFD